MQYVLIDDSVPFDGYTAARRAMGGAEKALANLAAALAARGHTVTLLNKTPYPVTADNVRYRPLEELHERPLEADVVIASRRPELLGIVRKAKHRLLWVTAQPDYLAHPANKTLWDSFTPTVLFVSKGQAAEYKGTLPYHVVEPCVGATFYETPADVDPYPELGADGMHSSPLPPEDKVIPPHAVVTTHPLHGLVWLLEIWRRLIYPQMNEARLAVHSTVLARGLRGEEVPDPIKPVLERVKLATDSNVVVVDPRSDRGMADVYRESRVHIYPGHPQDYACWTLAESQAAGLPAVGRNIGGFAERIANSQTGFVAPDASAVANTVLQLLRHDEVYKSFSAAASDITRRRTWEIAAMEIEQIVGGPNA